MSTFPVTTTPALYPTWFRWKAARSIDIALGLLFFISHMVQMKDKNDLSREWYNIVFISHMVQMKVQRQLSLPLPMISLYPTWFRWKIITLYIRKKMKMTLYPTWFRWKHLRDLQRYSTQKPLYPTWFRWKNDLGADIGFLEDLYIPHGSDERSSVCSISVVLVVFISHMVQMKVSIYKEDHKEFSNLYIPHGSDERKVA